MLDVVWENLPKEFAERLLRGIKHLMPPQEEALKKGIFSDRNFLISSPTASGKTLIAEMAFCKGISEGKKAVYVVPLRSIAFEKFKEFSEKYKNLFKVAISVGDYDSSDPWLEEYDLIVVTAEKLDSLMRHKAKWLKDVGVLIVDEVHLLGDPSRGATLEILITKFRMLSNPRIVCLSATVENSEEIADWLGAELVKSNWRPCKLYHKILFENALINSEEERLNSNYRDHFRALCEDTLRRGKQIIFFMGSRKRAEALAKRLASVVRKYLNEPEKIALKHLSERVRNVLDVPTDQCILLSELVKDGVAFHHAGLLNEQRILIEEGFRKGFLKVLCATPTLAMGVNLPAFRVFIEKKRGNTWISPVEYHQMAGRAGRPGYEEYGEAITFAKDEEEIEEIRKKYHSGKLNIIKSSLFSENVLRMHLLALVSEGFIYDRESLKNFMGKTFFSHQFGENDKLVDYCDRIIKDLIGWDFVREERGYYLPTRIGKRISELYIDPLTAHNWLELSRRIKKMDDICILYMISCSEEVKPLPEFEIKEFPILRDWYMRNRESIPEEEPEAWLWSDFYSKIKLTIILKSWIDEVPEKVIMERFGISPGDLRTITNISEWLAYSLGEIWKVSGEGNPKYAKIVSERLRWGVKEELLDLVKIKNVGRVRARILYNAGIRSREDIIRAGIGRLKSILGERLGEKVYYSALGKEILRRERLTDYFYPP